MGLGTIISVTTKTSLGLLENPQEIRKGTWKSWMKHDLYQSGHTLRYFWWLLYGYILLFPYIYNIQIEYILRSVSPTGPKGLVNGMLMGVPLCSVYHSTKFCLVWMTFGQSKYIKFKGYYLSLIEQLDGSQMCIWLVVYLPL